MSSSQAASRSASGPAIALPLTLSTLCLLKGPSSQCAYLSPGQAAAPTQLAQIKALAGSVKSGRGSGLSIEPADWRLHPAQAPSTTEDDGIPPYFPEGSARPAKTLQAPGGLKRLIQGVSVKVAGINELAGLDVLDLSAELDHQHAPLPELLAAVPTRLDELRLRLTAAVALNGVFATQGVLQPLSGKAIKFLIITFKEQAFRSISDLYLTHLPLRVQMVCVVSKSERRPLAQLQLATTLRQLVFVNVDVSCRLLATAAPLVMVMELIDCTVAEVDALQDLIKLRVLDLRRAQLQQEDGLQLAVNAVTPRVSLLLASSDAFQLCDMAQAAYEHVIASNDALRESEHVLLHRDAAEQLRAKGWLQGHPGCRVCAGTLWGEQTPAAFGQGIWADAVSLAAQEARAPTAPPAEQQPQQQQQLGVFSIPRSIISTISKAFSKCGLARPPVKDGYKQQD